MPSAVTDRGLHSTGAPPPLPAREAILREVQAQCHQWPELMHHYDDWALGCLTRRVYRFGKLYGDAGDLVLFTEQDGAARFYSTAVMVDISVPMTHIRVV